MRLGRDRQRGVKEGEEGRGSQAKAPRGPPAEGTVGPRVRAGGPHQQAMGRMASEGTSCGQGWAQGSQDLPAPRVQEGVWPGPRGRVAPDTLRPCFPGLASSEPGNQPVSLNPPCSLQRLPIGQTRKEARGLRGPLEVATRVRGQGPEGDGRARRWWGVPTGQQPRPCSTAPRQAA